VSNCRLRSSGCSCVCSVVVFLVKFWGFLVLLMLFVNRARGSALFPSIARAGWQVVSLVAGSVVLVGSSVSPLVCCLFIWIVGMLNVLLVC